MAQQYPPNDMYPETRAASDAAVAASEAAGVIVLGPKQKYIDVGSSKNVSRKSNNSGKAGRRYRRQMRGHAGGQISTEEKERRTKESNAAVKASQAPKYVR